VPMHATRIQNPVAALAVLQVLTKMLNIEVDIGELSQIANEAADRLKQVAAEAMGEYIDNFTRPIWEYGEEDEEEED
jgi:predicted ATP-grasp superfamily ATP-dependent carboligase